MSVESVEQYTYEEWMTTPGLGPAPSIEQWAAFHAERDPNLTDTQAVRLRHVLTSTSS